MAALTCVPIAAPEATMIASTNRTPSSGGPNHEADHQRDPRGSVFPRIVDAAEQPPDRRSALCRRILRAARQPRDWVGVFESSTRVDVLPPGVGRCAR